MKRTVTSSLRSLNSPFNHSSLFQLAALRINILSSVVRRPLRPGPSSHRVTHTECLEVYLQKCTERLQFRPSEKFRCTLRSVAVALRSPNVSVALRGGGHHFTYLYVYSFFFIQCRATDGDSEELVARTSEAIIETKSTFGLRVNCEDPRRRSERMRKREIAVKRDKVARPYSALFLDF